MAPDYEEPETFVPPDPPEDGTEETFEETGDVPDPENFE